LWGNTVIMISRLVKMKISTLNLILTGLCTVLLLSGCQTTSDLGGENKEISEAESNIVFYGPGLDGGFRRIISGHDSKTRMDQVISIYGPRAGKTPYAEIYYKRITRTNYFFKNLKIDTLIDRVLSDYEDGAVNKPDIIAKGQKKNKLGVIHYATYMLPDEACVMFFQTYGKYADGPNLKGDKLIAGSYCDAASKPFTDHQVEGVLSMLGDKNSKYPEKPKGWAAAEVSSDALLQRKMAAKWLFSLDWDDVGEINNIPVTLNLDGVDLIGSFEFTQSMLGQCKGLGRIDAYKLNHTKSNLMGSWEITCAKVTASGNITARAQDGSGTGRDSKGRMIIVTLSAS